MQEAEAGGTIGNLPVLVSAEKFKNFDKYRQVRHVLDGRR